MGQWNWDAVFHHIVEQCDKHGGYYRVTPEQVAHLKDGEVGVGWGEANLRRTILPRYRARYPSYRLNLACGRKCLECARAC